MEANQWDRLRELLADRAPWPSAKARQRCRARLQCQTKVQAASKWEPEYTRGLLMVEYPQGIYRYATVIGTYEGDAAAARIKCRNLVHRAEFAAATAVRMLESEVSVHASLAVLNATEAVVLLARAVREVDGNAVEILEKILDRLEWCVTPAATK